MTAVALDDAAWWVDARRGAVDLVGSADPVPMNGTLLPADNKVRAVSLNTNEGGDGVNSTGSYLWTDDSAIAVTGDIDIRCSHAAIDDVTNDGVVPQAVKVAKYLGDTINTFDYMVSVLTNAGESHFSGSGLSSDIGTGLDLYSDVALRWTRTTADGVVSAYIEDDADPDVTTADGRNWRLIGTDTGATGDLDDTTNSILTFSVGKGFGGWCQIYDGVDGTLVVDMDVDRDATAGLVSGGTFTDATDITWTLNDNCTTFLCDRAAWIVGTPMPTADGPFTVADANSLDIGTGDFTVAMVYEPSTLASGGSDFRTLLFKANPATIGSSGVGWGFVDYGPLGGVGFAINDGGGLESGCFTTWDAGVRHLMVATGDRGGNLSLYVDDMVTPAATTDITDTTDTLTNSDDLSSGTPDPALLAAAAKWDRVLTAPELAALPALLAA